MTESRQTKKWVLSVVVGGLFTLFCMGVWADARSDYLINMLEKGGTYRVKVQAASSLGRIRCKEAIPALKKALGDENELVIIAAATALGQIGDTSVITALENAEQNVSSAAAKSQLATTLRILRSLEPEQPSEGETVAGASLYLAKIDAMGNSSNTSRQDIEQVLKHIVVQSLSHQGGIVIQQEDLTESQVKQKLKKDKLKGFIISGSLLKLEKVQNYIEVSISLNVFSNPDYNLLMMPSGGIRVPVNSGGITPEEEKKAQEDAIRRLVDDLVKKVIQALPDVL